MRFSFFSISLILALAMHVLADCDQEDIAKMQKCFEDSGMANMNNQDDEQRCAIVKQLSQCFNERSDDCETEIKGFVSEISGVFTNEGQEPIPCIKNFIDNPMDPIGSGSVKNSAVLITTLLLAIGNVLAF
eukprot:04534.XXX_241070_240548_1 [CDS] Oithona nana genome sequencing.